MDDVTERPPKAGWQHDLYDLLRRHGVTQFAYVPDAGHTIMIDRSLADADVFSIPLTTEEEGVALAAGADLGGARACCSCSRAGSATASTCSPSSRGRASRSSRW